MENRNHKHTTESNYKKDGDLNVKPSTHGRHPLPQKPHPVKNIYRGLGKEKAGNKAGRGQPHKESKQ